MKYFIVIIGIALAMVHSSYSCSCAKPKQDEEVCGSDGTNYESGCLLYCFALYRKASESCLTEVSKGKCALPECICTDTCNHVCASNGQTYGNDCTLKCAQKLNPNLTKVKNGKCD